MNLCPVRNYNPSDPEYNLEKLLKAVIDCLHPGTYIRYEDSLGTLKFIENHLKNRLIIDEEDKKLRTKILEIIEFTISIECLTEISNFNKSDYFGEKSGLVSYLTKQNSKFLRND